MRLIREADWHHLFDAVLEKVIHRGWPSLDSRHNLSQGTSGIKDMEASAKHPPLCLALLATAMMCSSIISNQHAQAQSLHAYWQSTSSFMTTKKKRKVFLYISVPSGEHGIL